MPTLYRVLSESNWKKAQETGYVARCGNDVKADGVHLNLPEAVEYTAARYFTPDEAPLVLEVDYQSFEESLEWHEPTAEEPWRKPLARIANLPLNAVVTTHELRPSDPSGQTAYRWIRGNQ